MTPAELKSLIDALLDEQISAADFRRLEQELEHNRAARETWFDRVTLQSLLQADGESGSPAPAPTSLSESTPRGGWLVGVAVAAAIVLMTGLGWWVGRFGQAAGARTANSPVVAKTTRSGTADHDRKEATSNGIALLTQRN